MHLQRIGLTALITVLTTLVSVDLGFPVLGQLIQNPKSKIQNSQVLAQTPTDRKAQADRLFQQGTEQARTGQFAAALQPLQQALTIYREIGDTRQEAVTFISLGGAYLGLNDLPRATNSLQQSLSLARAINDRQVEVLALQGLSLAQSASNPRKAEADQLLQQGIQQLQTSQFEAALQSFQQALTIYQEIKHRLGEGYALNALGFVHVLSLGDYAKAIEYYQQSLAIVREFKDRKGEGNALGNMGFAYSQLGNYPKAIDYQQQSLAILREIQDRQTEGTILGNLGLTYFSLKDYAKAIEYHQQHLAIARELKDRKGEGNALGNLGLAYDALEDRTKAIEYYQQQLAITREINDRWGEGNALGNLGVAYQALKDYAKAIEYQQQRLALAREIKDRPGEGAALENLGSAYQALKDYAKATEYHQQRLALAREINDRKGEGKALANLGNIYNALENYAKAIEYHQQCLAIAREVQDRKGEGESLGILGQAYIYIGDYVKAIEYHQQQLAIAREIQDRKGEGQALGNLGLAYFYLGDSAKAIEYHQQDLAIARETKDRRGEGQALGNLGLDYFMLGDYAKAIEYHQQHLAITQEIKDRLGEGHALGNLGLAYFYLGDSAKVIDYWQQTLAIARKMNNKYAEGNALNNLGYAFQKSGNLTAAEENLRAGIEVWESQRKLLGDNDTYKVSIFEQQARTYRILQEVLIAQNKTTAALEISERGRARAFVELLAKRLSTPEAQDLAELPTLEAPTIEQIKQIAKAQNAILVQYSIINDDFKFQGKLEGRESELYIWVIKPTGEVTFRRSDLKPLWQQQNSSLKDLVTLTRESIGVSRSLFSMEVVNPVNEESQTKRLQQLHQLLIEPIADLLPTNPNERVVFIPQESLFLAPFPALQDKDGKYLIEKHTILTSPSIQVLELTRKQRERVGARRIVSPQDALVVGNPTMPSLQPYPGEKPQQLDPLPGAEREAIAIAPLLNTQPLIGNQATESAIKQLMPKARLIHLATHGLLDDIRGIGSAIALAPDSPSSSKQELGAIDGLLTAEEIFDLKLNAELVVLSACNTGQGRITGDGVVGLSRSLISAGVPSVIVSLWAVPDAPTAELMTEFYSNFQERKLDKAQALRQAMLTTMKKHPNPQKWAAFTLIGEAD